MCAAPCGTAPPPRQKKLPPTPAAAPAGRGGKKQNWRQTQVLVAAAAGGRPGKRPQNRSFFVENPVESVKKQWKTRPKPPAAVPDPWIFVFCAGGFSTGLILHIEKRWKAGFNAKFSRPQRGRWKKEGPKPLFSTFSTGFSTSCARGGYTNRKIKSRFFPFIFQLSPCYAKRRYILCICPPEECCLGKTEPPFPRRC